MPESAEVRRLTADLQDVVGQTITDAEIISGRYLRTPIVGFDTLVGKRITAIRCKGKLIYFDFEAEDGSTSHALSTLGMTGWWQQFRRIFKYGRSARFCLALGQLRLVFNDTRNFGTFKLVDRAELLKKLNELGPVELAWRKSHELSHAMFTDEEVAGPERLILEELTQFNCYGRRRDSFGNTVERYQDKNGRMVWWAPARQS